MAWKKVKLNQILLKYENYIELEDNVEYKQVTIKMWNKGLILRCNKFGHEIGSKKQNQIKPNLFLISKIDARNGAWGVVPEYLDNSIITNSFLAYELSKEISMEWFNLYMKNPDFVQLCISLSEGTTNRKTLNVKKFMETEIEFPDLKTQIEIVKRYNKIEDKNLILNFDNQQSHIKKLREAILQEAVQGKLVEQNEADESAEILFEKIRKEKEQLIKDKKIKKEKPLPEISADEVPYDLPSGWKWCRLGDVIELISGRDEKTSDCNNKSNGIPYIMGASNIQNGKILVERWIENPKVIGLKNDILISVKGTVGKIIIQNLEFTNLSRQIMAVRNKFNLNLFYLELFMNSYVDFFKKKSIGLIPGISRENVLNSLFPLPPLEEQKRIVEKVDSLMSFCDTLEQEVISSKESAEKLLQSVLREAFSEE